MSDVCGLHQSSFSADPSALGYLYQFIYALKESVLMLTETDSFAMGIETLDDIAFSLEDNTLRLYQTKRHATESAISSTGDMSVDLWKTLRIWMKEQLPGIRNNNVKLFFVTTEKCKDNTALFFIKKQDLRSAITALDAAAKKSKNKENQDAYQIYLGLDISQKLKLIEAICVVDEAKDFCEVRTMLKKSLHHATTQKLLDSLVDRLEQWWLKRVLLHLNSNPKQMIHSSEIQNYIDLLRDQLKGDSLPMDKDILDTEIDYKDFFNMIFTKQLTVIGFNKLGLLQAMKNYYRASTLRSRWAREDLLYINELDSFDSRLFREWEDMFAIIYDSLQDSCSDADIMAQGKKLYEAMQYVTPPLRAGMTDSVIARGTYHILSDALRIGWHKDFKAIFEQET